jgi:hypothetical protein
MEDGKNMKDKSMDEVLSFPIEESEEVIEKGDADSGLICTCGHSGKYHNESEVDYCLVGRQACRCNEFIPVLKVSDTRHFMRKSQGNGNLHALSLGIASARLVKAKTETETNPQTGIKTRTKKPVEMKWNLDICCMKCMRSDVGLSPTMVSLQGQIIYEPDVIYKDQLDVKIFNLMLCDDCIDEISTVRGV